MTSKTDLLVSRAYPDHESESEMVREGFEPSGRLKQSSGGQHNLDAPFAVKDGEKADEAEQLWKERDYTHDDE